MKVSLNLMFRKLLPYLFLLAVLAINLFLAVQAAWQVHLHTDVNVYFDRVSYFLGHGSFAGLFNNEYLPGALAFLLAISSPLLVKNNYEVYTLTLFGANILLVLVLAGIYRKSGAAGGPVVLGLILLFTGPIFLYRFDLYVMLLVIGALFARKKGKNGIALFLLSLGTLTKIFPVILLPYFLMLTGKNRGRAAAVKDLGIFAAWIIVMAAGLSAVLGINFAQLDSTRHFLAQIPVHTESTWAVLLGIGAILRGGFLRGQGAWGTYGVAPEFTPWPLWFFAGAGFAAVGLIYLLIWRRIKKGDGVDVRAAMIVILTFLLFSRVLNHQYLLWFMLLLPMMSSAKWRTVSWRINLGLVLAATLLNQIVYPLNYTPWMNELFSGGQKQYLFWLVAVRTALLFAVLVRISGEFLREKRAD